MKKYTLLLILFILTPAHAGPKTPKGSTALFDGKSLAGWKTQKADGHHWKADADGNLARVGPEGKKTGGGYIWTEKTFGDFVLDLEFKMNPECNSGVFIRTDPKNAVQGGFEIQVMDTASLPEIDAHACGALYDAVTPSENAAKPAGEWNRMRIRCQGPRIAVTLNGKKIVNANLDEWTTPQLNPDGSKNKFKTALKDLPRTGHIGLQDYGRNVWFRNIAIKELK